MLQNITKMSNIQESVINQIIIAFNIYGHEKHKVINI